MPELSVEDQAKLTTLEALFEAARRGGPRVKFAELTKIAWPDTDRWYAFTQIDEIAGFTSISSFAEVRARLLSAKDSPFLDVPKTSSISDDSVGLDFSDIDGELSRLCYLYGAGVRAFIYNYYPDVDLKLLIFLGTLRAPKDADGRTLKLTITSGWRSSKLLLPRRLPAPGCMFIFGGLLSSQAEIDAHKGCPYNKHLEGMPGVGTIIGVNDPATGEPWTDCARDSAETCFAHLNTKKWYPGFRTVVEGVVNFQTKGPNLLSVARGNDSTLTDPIRVIYGDRQIKSLRLLAYAPEDDTNHPEKGFVRALWEISEGPLNALSQFRMNNVLVGLEHQNLRLGTLGQAQTGMSPNIGHYSGTAVAFGRIQGDFRNVSASSLSASIRGRGLNDVRVYSDEDTFVEQYTTIPIWCIADALTKKRWGYGEDYSRYDIANLMECADWHSETVKFTDPNGNHFDGIRSTFNAELTARSTQTQIEDACTACRLSPPFEHNGKKIFTPLRKETIDDSIPYFTDYGSDANICIDSNKQPMVSWSYTGDEELVNQYTVTFDDASNGFISTPLIFGDQRQQLAAGRAWGDSTVRIINKEVPAFGITNMPEAARLGNLLLALGPRDSGGIENNLSVKLTTWFSQAFEVRMHRLVKLRIRGLVQLFGSLGIPGFEYFRATKMQRKGDLKVELTCQAYPVDYYDQIEDPALPPPIIGQGSNPNPGGGSLDRPFPPHIIAAGHMQDLIYVHMRRPA